MPRYKVTFVNRVRAEAVLIWESVAADDVTATTAATADILTGPNPMADEPDLYDLVSVELA